MEPHDEKMARILSQETNYAFSSYSERVTTYLERVRQHVITGLNQAVKNDPGHGNSNLILATAIRETLEDYAVDELHAELEALPDN